MNAARLGIIVKVQNHIHGSRLVRMTQWVEDAAVVPLYDEVHGISLGKVIDPRWGSQLSAYRVHATYLAFRKDGPMHKRRRNARGEAARGG